MADSTAEIKQAPVLDNKAANGSEDVPDAGAPTPEVVTTPAPSSDTPPESPAKKEVVNPPKPTTEDSKKLVNGDETINEKQDGNIPDNKEAEPTAVVSNGDVASAAEEVSPVIEEQVIQPIKASKISRGSGFRKFIKRSKSTPKDPEEPESPAAAGPSASVSQTPDQTSLDGDSADKVSLASSTSREDIGASEKNDKSRTNSLRKRFSLGHQSGSQTSISSRDSVGSSEERDPGAILSRQLSRKNSKTNKPNPIQENEVTRLLLLFTSTIFGWFLKLIIFLWGQGVGFFTDVPEPVEEAVPEEEKEEPGIIPLKPEITQPTKERIFFICNELKNTEEVYVDRLQILVNAKERATAIVGADTAKQMFKDIEVICLFHSNYLLPDLKERMANWEEHRKIGDIMKKLTPYLKLYTDYVKDFSKAEAMVDYWENKSSTFAAMIRDIRDTQAARHGKLKVQAHMIEPIQRVPRYELLLRDYLKRLPDGAPDKADAEQALVSVSQAASHFEAVMKRDTRIAKLIEIRERLDSYVNIVLPTRDFISESKMNIFSQRTQKPSEKTTFLFNDLFLVCSQPKIQKIMTSMKLKVKVAIDLREAELISGTNLDIPYTLWLQTKDDTHTEICFNSAAEMAQWRQMAQALIDAFTKTLLRNSTCSSTDSTEGDEVVESVHEGHVQVSSDDARTWRRRWMIVGTCGRLFAYKTQQDKTPISWIRIVRFNLESANNSRKANTLVLQGFGRKYFLHFENQNEYNEWFEVLQRYQESSSPDGLDETSREKTTDA